MQFAKGSGPARIYQTDFSNQWQCFYSSSLVAKNKLLSEGRMEILMGGKIIFLGTGLRMGDIATREHILREVRRHVGRVCA